MEKIERKEILNATDYFMNNQYDHLDLDVYNLFLDESDVGASVELEERLRSPNHYALGGGRNEKKNGWMLCDERYIFEDNDVEILFEITNEHIAAVLRPNIVFHDCENVQTSCAVSIGSAFLVYVQCYLAYSLA